MSILHAYLISVAAAYVAQQGATWMSMLSWERILKAAAWPVVLFRPLIASVQSKHEEELRRKGGH